MPAKRQQQTIKRKTAGKKSSKKTNQQRSTLLISIHRTQAVFLLLLYLLLCVLSWVFPILSRFTFGFAALNRTALRIALGNILRSALMALLTGLGIAAFAQNYFFVFFVPGLIAWLSSYLIEPVFEKYSDPE